MKRTIAVAVGALSLAASGVIGFSAVAQAESDQRDTRAGKFTLYEHDDFEGRQWSFYPDNNCWKPSGSWASSMKNGSDRWVWLYSGERCTGDAGYGARPHTTDDDLTDNDWDNRTRTVR
ncbi:peptidase inhibitor family I36 protein [Streptomyces sp. ISL-22]|uniref:Beta/gamma crystallin 'Greek key' domain-containing protein n=1 Tax=Streptomyces curacoi TaxID=146536 RepID=A0A117PHM4_9ACTN|nr:MULTISPECIES: peptidase inhibitor family I36 protein [Streptomyces]KUM79796.1 hypothetical protein AQI70_06280 [Streptomyces curacoi]MBT2423862.1 peptidase inhibitor family I36 protein [Streptomyces sp. ISL-24]MBT2437498.1 peptidase inhibitor family I36 protein [Streptomyces sp. ISL-22]